MIVPLLPVAVHRCPGPNFGASEFAAARGLAITAYVDDEGVPQRSALDEIPSVTFAWWRECLQQIPSIVTALDPALRRAAAERIAAHGGAFVTGRPNDKAVSHTVTFGDGTLSGNGPLFIASLTTFGRHVVIMTPVSIGHDCVIGDFVTIQPAVAISGHVVIEDDVVIGVGAVIVNGLAAKPLHVRRGAYIAAGAVVTKSVPAGVIVAGNPGRPVRRSVDRHE